MRDPAPGPRRRVPFGLRGRVALAMLVPLALALGISGWAAVSSVSRTVETRERERLERSARLLRDLAAKFLVSARGRPELLRQVADALGGDVLVHDRAGPALHTTLTDGPADAFREWAVGLSAVDVPWGEPSPVRLDGRGYLVLGESLGGHDIFVVYPGDPVTEAVARARKPILLAGAAAMVGAALLAFLLASLITRPLKQLATEASAVAGGDLDREVAVRSSDETGDLAAAFNRMLEGLRTYRSDLVRAERLAVLGQIATGIAHELRNPLTAVRMNVQMLPAEEDRATREEDAALVLEEIDRLERSIDDLMAIARPEPPELGAVRVDDLVEETLRLLARQLDHLGIRVETSIPSDVPAIRGEERRLRQVLLNLLLNAAQAMPGGGVARVEAQADGDHVRLSVSDEGEGIPDDFADRVFEPFVSGQDGGTGLGLAVSRQIVDAHGGTIGFRRLDEGTAFDVRLPRA